MIAHAEQVQMAIEPAHRQLHHLMKLGKRDRGGHDQAAPDWRANVLQRPWCPKTAPACVGVQRIQNDAEPGFARSFSASED